MIDEIAETFPALVSFSPKNLENAKDALSLAGMRAKPENYLSFALVSSLASSLLLFLFLLSLAPIEQSIPLALLGFSGIFLSLLRLPSFLAKRRGEAVEADLPVALRSFAAELGMGIPFEKALVHASESPYAIAPELRKAVLEMRGGAGASEALLGTALRVDSLMVKRAIQQMLDSYKQGSGGEGLKHLADELIERQKALSREHNARIAFLGLLFVALSCIVPALFQAYAIVGSAFLSSPLSASEIWLYYLVLFPLANAMVLLAIYERTPKALGTRQGGIFSRKQAALADRALASRGIGLGFRKLVVYIAAGAAALCFFLLLGSFLFHYWPWVSLLPFAVPLLAYFWVLRLVEVRTAQIEARLPDALLQASSFPKGTPTDKIIRFISESGYGPLSEEFAFANRQIASGADVPGALRAIAEGNDSTLLLRACELMSQAYSGGGDMHKAMKETAEDMFAIFSIVREKESTLALQKYTLLFGGGLIVPVVLGAIGSAVFRLGGAGIESISSLTAAERASLLGASIGAAQAYLVIYSLLASLFIAQLSGSWRNFVPYFAAMAPVALIAYNLALNFNVLAVG